VLRHGFGSDDALHRGVCGTDYPAVDDGGEDLVGSVLDVRQVFVDLRI
jgi:hypothetical protein